MKKYFLILFIFLFANKAIAYDAVVIVLEAPLLKSPDLSSKVLQNLRKGERVFVPREVWEKDSLPEFIPTFDRVGNRAYIPARYIKVITNNIDENRLPLNITVHDSTDYRLQEPIPLSYPFEDRSFLRASVALSVSNNTKSPYEYNSSFNKQDYQNETGARVTVMKKVAYDKYDRFYFGLIGIVSSSRTKLSFQNNNSAEENRSVLRLGPLLTFDVFKNENYRLTTGAGFTYNYHRSTVTIESPLNSEQRLFSGTSLSPLATTTLQIKDVLPNTDLMSGLDFSLYLPHSQTSSDAIEFPELWAESNTIKSNLKPQITLFMGIQVRY